jgi:hypothetical protein
LRRLESHGLLISVDADRPIDRITTALLHALSARHRRVMSAGTPVARTSGTFGRRP